MSAPATNAGQGQVQPAPQPALQPALQPQPQPQPQPPAAPPATAPAYQPGDVVVGFSITPQERARRLTRQERFWQPGFAGEGAYFTVTASVAPVAPRKQPSIPTLEEFLSPEKHYADTIEQLEQTCYGGDALPIAQADFGPGILPAVLGRPYRLGVDTVWFDEHAFDDPAEVEKLVFDHTAAIYRACLKTTELLTSRSKGRYTVAIADMGSTLDALAALYKRELVLMDFALDPERIARLLSLVGDWWQEGMRAIIALLRATETHISSWVPIVSKNTWFAQLSELSAMISPHSFEALSLPALAREAELFDQIVFNIDGDSYARHLPNVLKIPKLHAIDWAPTRKYVAPDVSYKVFTEPYVLEVAREVQKHVKLVVNGIPSWQVEEVIEQIALDGTFFIVNCDTLEEAQEFVELSRRWIKS